MNFPREWLFVKYVGSGNDFILFDNRKKEFPTSSTIIRSLCHRQKGIGADGVILLENSTKENANHRFRIFNSDGSEAEMCGNGMRCFIKWLGDLGLSSDCYQIETMQSILNVKKMGNLICIDMGSPRNIKWDISLRFDNQFLRLHALNTGVPHVVVFVDNLDQINLSTLGPYIRHYSLFTPQGTNVTVAQKKEGNKLKIRTYERGVEGETFGCGTGATAAALAAAKKNHMESPICVETYLGDEVSIAFNHDNHEFRDVTLTGSAEHIFSGKIFLSTRFQS